MSVLYVLAGLVLIEKPESANKTVRLGEPNRIFTRLRRTLPPSPPPFSEAHAARKMRGPTCQNPRPLGRTKIAKRRQLMRIAFPCQNGLDDRLSRHSAHIAQHIRQLEIHLRQRLLHPLDVPPCRLHQIIALPPVRPHRADLRRWPKRISQ